MSKRGEMVSMKRILSKLLNFKTFTMMNVKKEVLDYTPQSEHIHANLKKATLYLAFKKFLECILSKQTPLYILSFLLAIFFFSNLATSYAVEIDTHLLADAIKVAEGSKNHPYGILRSYCKPNDPDGQCRKGCIQTIEKWKKKLTYNTNEEFIAKFGAIYCPIGASNDPNGLNRNWVKNVTLLYKKRESEAQHGVSTGKKVSARQEGKSA